MDHGVEWDRDGNMISSMVALVLLCGSNDVLKKKSNVKYIHVQKNGFLGKQGSTSSWEQCWGINV